MKKTWIIAKRDFKSYFTSPIAYIVIALFLGIMGFMFFNTLSWYNQSQFQYQQYGMGKSVSITRGILQPLYGNMNVVLLFLLPFITMRLFAEERKNQTIALLLTSPVTLTEMVLGKFLSALILLIVMLLGTLFYPAVLLMTGNPEIGAIFSSYLGTFLMGSSILSLGILFSSMSENQIVAGALTFGAGLFLWIINWIAQSAGPVLSELLNYFSLISHYNQFSSGVIDSSDAVFYLSFIGICLYLTYRVLDSYRWRN